MGGGEVYVAVSGPTELPYDHGAKEPPHWIFQPTDL